MAQNIDYSKWFDGNKDCDQLWFVTVGRRTQAFKKESHALAHARMIGDVATVALVTRAEAMPVAETANVETTNAEADAAAAAAEPVADAVVDAADSGKKGKKGKK